MYMKPLRLLHHLYFANYYSKVMVTIIPVSTPFMEVISGAHSLKACLYLMKNIMLGGL